MGRILFIDACVREQSRTRRLARALLERLGPEDAVERVDLAALPLHPLTEAELHQRDEALRQGDFSAADFDLARQFAAADGIVIAAPYWDLSFPAALRLYLERVSVTGLTFRYDETGRPAGLCRAGRLFYVTTAGGGIGAMNFGYDYVRALAVGLYGIPDTRCVSAEGLDLWGADPEAILAAAIEALDP